MLGFKASFTVAATSLSPPVPLWDGIWVGDAGAMLIYVWILDPVC